MKTLIPMLVLSLALPAAAQEDVPQEAAAVASPRPVLVWMVNARKLPGKLKKSAEADVAAALAAQENWQPVELDKKQRRQAKKATRKCRREVKPECVAKLAALVPGTKAVVVGLVSGKRKKLQLALALWQPDGTEPLATVSAAVVKASWSDDAAKLVSDLIAALPSAEPEAAPPVPEDDAEPETTEGVAETAEVTESVSEVAVAETETAPATEPVGESTTTETATATEPVGESTTTETATATEPVGESATTETAEGEAGEAVTDETPDEPGELEVTEVAAASVDVSPQVALEASVDTEERPADTDGIGLIFGPKLGVMVPTSKLKATYFGALELAYAPPALSQAIGIVVAFGVEAAYAKPPLSGSDSDPRAGDYDYALDQRLGMLAVEATALIPVGPLTVYAGGGYGFYFLRAKVEAFGKKNAENQLRAAVQLRAGAGYRLGPGDVVAEVRYHYVNLRFLATGQSNAGGVTLGAGYRFRL